MTPTPIRANTFACLESTNAYLMYVLNSLQYDIRNYTMCIIDFSPSRHNHISLINNYGTLILPRKLLRYINYLAVFEFIGYTDLAASLA